MSTKFKVGSTYRNRYMIDVDFWVSKIDEGRYTGWWILRRNGRILNREADTIKGLRNADWSEVNDAESGSDQ